LRQIRYKDNCQSSLIIDVSDTTYLASLAQLPSHYSDFVSDFGCLRRFFWHEQPSAVTRSVDQFRVNIITGF
jgi:hypothetical protein